MDETTCAAQAADAEPDSTATTPLLPGRHHDGSWPPDPITDEQASAHRRRYRSERRAQGLSRHDRMMAGIQAALAQRKGECHE